MGFAKIKTGGQSSVFLKNEKDQVVKKYHKGYKPSNLNNELYILRNLNHTNIIKYFDYTLKDQSVQIHMEYWGKNLTEKLHLSIGSIKFCTKVYYEVISGLTALHNINLVHCDIKPENILYHKSHIKICDFGSTRLSNERRDITTPMYNPPEIIFNKRCYPESDWWSLGCTIYEIYTGMTLFKNNLNIIRASLLQYKKTKELNIKIDNPIKDLIKDCMKYNPKDRIITTY